MTMTTKKNTATVGLAEQVATLEAEQVAVWVADNLRDPDDQAAVAALLAGWKAKDAIAQLERARRLVRRGKRDQTRRDRERDPDWWAPRMAAAGWTQIRAVWPDAPVPADLGVNPASGWSIDEKGVHVTTGAGGRQWLCTPAVRDDTGTISLLSRGRWVGIDRGESTEATIQAALAAGLKAAPSIVVDDQRDPPRPPGVRVPTVHGAPTGPETAPGLAFVNWWLCGVGLDGGIGKHPCASFKRIEGETPPEQRYESIEERKNTAEALTRYRYKTSGGRIL